jgi:hypothetical protein
MIVDGKERSTLNYFNNSVIVGAYGVFGTTWVFIFIFEQQDKDLIVYFRMFKEYYC